MEDKNKQLAHDLINSGKVDKIYFNMTNGLYWKLLNYDLVKDKPTGLIRIQSNHAHKIMKVLQPLPEEFYFDLMCKRTIMLIDGSNRDNNCSDAFRKTLTLMTMMYNKFMMVDFKDRVDPLLINKYNHDIVFERFPEDCYVDTKLLFYREENKVDYLKRFYLDDQERRGVIVLNLGKSKVIERNHFESMEELEVWKQKYPNDCVIITYTESPFVYDDLTYPEMVAKFPEIKDIPLC